MVSDTPAPNGPASTTTSVESNTSSTTSLVEYIKIMESRLDDLTKKYDDLAAKQKEGASDSESKKESEDGEKEKDKDKNKEDPEKPADSDDIDENIKLIPELNRLTWVQWRKLKTWEENWETKTPAQKKKELQNRRVKLKKFVIDVVADRGDLGLHATADRQVPGKETWTPGRIRINSEHVMDALNEITSITVPTPCQILHPFKPIVDFVDPIKEHMKTLENNLEKAKSTLNAAKNKDTTEMKTETLSSVPPKKESPDSGKDKDAKGSKKDDPKKTLEEEEVELAEEKCSHYRCFLDLLETNLATEIKVSASIRSGNAKKIAFSHLWHLFVPGEKILFQDPNRIQPEQISQILKVSGGRARLQHPPTLPYYFFWNDKQFRSKYSPFTVDSFHLDFDGNSKKFRLVQKKYEIPRYSGECPIIALKVFPLRFLVEPRLSESLESLLKRGKIFQSLASVESAHREYHGMSLDKEKEEINGRIIVDFKFGAPESSKDRQSSDYSDTEEGRGIFGLRQLTQTDENEITETTPKGELDATLYNDHTYDIDKSDKIFLQNRVLLAPSQELNSTELTEDELRLLPGTAIAYVLRNRKYCKCDINLIEEIKRNESAFDQLVLPQGYHKLIQSLVDRHSNGQRPVEKKTEIDPPSASPNSRPEESDVNRAQQDTLSIVKGKGRGLIMLLHGVPGVGKTSTAETIADATGRPLLSVTCGDIGESASEVEKNLELIFTNSHRWGCVLLLDEAEVFLAKRSHEDLKRNAMVSVFLRVLEYYSGVLFLTTNRVGTIDEAFKSRIHISLYYPPLDWRTSKKIWQVNLDRSKDSISADDAAIIRFAKKHYHRSDENTRWNGRQIYNAFKTAIALVQIDEKEGKGKEEKGSDRRSKPKLQPDHFRQIAKASREFDQYLLETQGESMAAVNKQNRVRDDSFGLNDHPPTLKRRSTRTKQFDLSDLPSTSEEETGVSEDLSAESTEESEKERKRSKKKSSKKPSSSVSTKKKEKKKASSKKKKSEQESSEISDESS